MVRVKFHAFPDGRFLMEAAGHAGSAPRGEDLLCAAVSMLCYTAAQAVMESSMRGQLQGVPVIALKDGFARICARPRTRHRSSVRQIFRVIRCGLGLLARSAPECVRVEGTV